MPYVTVGTTKVHFTDSGGAGLAIVLGHGFFLDQEMFEQQAAGLAPQYRVISIDGRGHGRTGNGTAEFSYWDQARDAWAVVDKLGINHAVVGGHSQGGFIALRMALLCPKRVDGLILIGTSAEAYTPKQQAGYREVMDTWAGPAPLAPIAQTMASVMIGGTAADQQPWLDKWLSSDRGRLGLAADCLINRESITDLIGKITCPAVLLRGISDHAFSHHEMAALAEQLGGPAELHTVPGATHAVNITHADEVNKILRTFLGQLT